MGSVVELNSPRASQHTAGARTSEFWFAPAPSGHCRRDNYWDASRTGLQCRSPPHLKLCDGHEHLLARLFEGSNRPSDRVG